MATNTASGTATRPVKFPRQFTIMLSYDMFDRAKADAVRNGVSIGEVFRTYVEAGVEAGEAEAAAEKAAGLQS